MPLVLKTVFIYFLKDPENPAKGYLGKTGNPKSRLASHLTDKNPEDCPRTRWITALLVRGLRPTLEILDEVAGDEADAWEVAYIAFFRESGFTLMNETAGGSGLLNPEAETRAKISAGRRGDKNHFFGKRHTLETLEKIRAAKTGQNFTEEAKLKSSLSHRNQKHSNNKSGFVGVCWDSSRNRWSASISLPGKSMGLGRFKKLEDAVFVRALAADKYFST